MKMTLALNNPLQSSNINLGDSLRIREFEKKEVNNAVQGLTLDSLAAAKSNQTLIATSISTTGKFASEFFRRCQAAQTSQAGLEEDELEAAQLMTDSLIKAASEISTRFGQEKADEFLNDILAYTEQGLTENRLSGAISDFFTRLHKDFKGDLTQTSRLAELAQMFNRGLDILIDKENMLPERLANGETPGLAFAMNNFFSTDYTVSENNDSVTTKGFVFSFDHNRGSLDRVELTYSREPEWQEDGPVGPGQYFHIKIDNNISVGELADSETNETLLKIADYLRTRVGNEKAASFLETLPGDSKLMDSMNAAISMVALENGFDQAVEFVSYLNGTLKNTINDAAKDSVFNGWILHAQDKTSKPSGSVLTMHGGGPSGLDGIFEKGHFALDHSWRSNSGVGVGIGPTDLNKLYSKLT